MRSVENRGHERVVLKLVAPRADRAEHERDRLDSLDVMVPVAALVSFVERIGTMPTSTLKPKTWEGYAVSLPRVLAVFEPTRIASFKAQHARRYFHRCKRERSLSAARADLGALRGMLAKAVEWGAIDTHPMVGMRFEQVRPSTVDVEAWEIDALLSLDSTTRTVRVAQPYVRLKLMTGLRRGDLLRLRLSAIRDDGIYVTPAETEGTSGVSLIFQWIDDDGEPIAELREAVDEVLAIPPKRRGDDPFLSTTRNGDGFHDEETGRANGFDTLWQRFVDRAVAETSLGRRIKEKDLRAVVGAESASDEAAQALLGHSNVQTTRGGTTDAVRAS